MEPIENITAKLRQVVALFNNLHITPELADRYGNVGLMKIIYLFYIEYMGLNGGKINDDDALSRYEFYAWPYGPVEPWIYDIIGTIRNRLGGDQGEDWNVFENSNLQSLNRAAQRVCNISMQMSTVELVKLTHEKLHKWRMTPAYGKLHFADPDDYMNEFELLEEVVPINL